MNILFLSLGEFNSLEESSVHIDVVKQLSIMGHNVHVVCKTERRNKVSTHLENVSSIKILRVRIGNIKNTNIIEKGISTILLEYQFLLAIKKYFGDVKFDLVLYHTPPITYTKIVDYIKKRDAAKTYLLLKDIFPQNAVDMGMMKKSSILYKIFRRKEKLLYRISDRIGCMSQANVQYLLAHNKEVSRDKVEICPNSIYIKESIINAFDKEVLRTQYDLPLDKMIFVYGGNLGRPQGVDFIIECLKECSDLSNILFLIIGGGTDFHKLENFMKESSPTNVRIMTSLPNLEYESMIKACDVGLIFLDKRFTIPNYPSRILSYMQSCLPVFAVTDRSTDIGEDIISGDFGWWCHSDDSCLFKEKIVQISGENITHKGQNAYEYLCKNFDIRISAKKIEDFLK